MSKKNKNKNKNWSLDFSDVARKLFSIVIKKLSPVSFVGENIFGNEYYLSAFKGKYDTCVGCSLLDFNDKSKSRFRVTIGRDSTKTDEYLGETYSFCYILPFSRYSADPSKVSVYGYVVNVESSLRDECCFHIKIPEAEATEWDNFIVGIVEDNLNFVEVSSADEDGVLSKRETMNPDNDQEFILPNKSEIQRLIRNIE